MDRKFEASNMFGDRVSKLSAPVSKILRLSQLARLETARKYFPAGPSAAKIRFAWKSELCGRFGSPCPSEAADNMRSQMRAKQSLEFRAGRGGAA